MNNLKIKYIYLLFFLIVGSSCVANQSNLEVGLAQINITAPVGYSHYRGVSAGVHDSLYVKAIVFRMAAHSFALVVCDLLWIERDLSVDVRRRIKEETGISYSNVILSATHTHSSPSYHSNIDQLNEAERQVSHVNPMIEGISYVNWLSERVASAVVLAAANAVPVRLSEATFFVDGLAFNRRYVMTDGSVVMNPGISNPAVDIPIGPVDNSFPFIFIHRISDEKPLGAISNFALHADTFTGGAVFSGDFPGYLASFLSERFGKEFISIFTTAPSGDINHLDVVGGSEVKSAEEIGRVLADAVVLDSLVRSEVDLNTLSKYVYSPLQKYSFDELKWATSIPLENIYTERSFLTLRRSLKIKSLHSMRKSGEAIAPTISSLPWTLPLHIQAFKISEETAIVGLPGELFSAFAVEIRKRSPFKNTFIVELTNCHIAYVPDREAFSMGGYEVINSRLAPGEGERLCETAINLLKKL